MPRLTTKHYLEQRHLLRINWQQRRAAPFARLEAADQLYLYVFFAPTQDMSDQELVTFRAEISEQIPTLPQLAGRAYKKVLPYLDGTLPSGPPLPERTSRRKKPNQVVVVKGTRRPDEELVKRLLPLLKTIAREELKKTDRKSAS